MVSASCRANWAALDDRLLFCLVFLLGPHANCSMLNSTWLGPIGETSQSLHRGRAILLFRTTPPPSTQSPIAEPYFYSGRNAPGKCGILPRPVVRQILTAHNRSAAPRSLREFLSHTTTPKCGRRFLYDFTGVRTRNVTALRRGLLWRQAGGNKKSDFSESFSPA